MLIPNLLDIITDLQNRVKVLEGSSQIKNIIIPTGGKITIDTETADPPVENGRMYYNTTTGKYRACQAGVWADLTAAPPAPSATEAYKVGGFSQDQSTTGNVSYTGIGFKPKAIIFFSTPYSYNGTVYTSFGFDDGTTHFATAVAAAHNGNVPNMSIFAGDGVYWDFKACVSSFDTDGFTLTWYRDGTPPSGPMVVYYLALK